MVKVFAYVLPFLWSCLAFADEMRDAPIPEQMNWVGISVFMALFIGLPIGYGIFVWRKSKGKSDDNTQA